MSTLAQFFCSAASGAPPTPLLVPQKEPRSKSQRDARWNHRADMADLAVVAYELLRNPESVGLAPAEAVYRPSVPGFVAVGDLDEGAVLLAAPVSAGAPAPVAHTWNAPTEHPGSVALVPSVSLPTGEGAVHPVALHANHQEDDLPRASLLALEVPGRLVPTARLLQQGHFPAAEAPRTA